jgi:hypothetical protein
MAMAEHSYLKYDSRMTAVTHEKVSLSIDSDVISAIREQTGPRELSARVSDMLRRQLELDNLGTLVDELTAKRGRPLDLELVAQYREEMAG